MKNIIQELRKHSLNDIWNADEFGLIYKTVPSRTVGPDKLLGKKKKDRITYLACSNADGSEKFPLLNIGRTKSPKFFEKRSASDLGFDYQSNRNAWMAREIFFNWLKSFNDYIGLSSHRWVALLLDNALCHGSHLTIPCLKNVTVIFLPKNGNSFLQPLDAGIIAFVK